MSIFGYYSYIIILENFIRRFSIFTFILISLFLYLFHSVPNKPFIKPLHFIKFWIFGLKL